MKRQIIGCFLASVSLLQVFGQSNTQSSTISPYSQYGLGILADPSQGMSRSMGGTGIALRSGTLVNTINPASYSAVDSLTMLFDAGLSGQFTNFKEGHISANTRSADFTYAAGLFRMRKNLGVSFGLLPFSDVGYSYTTSTFLNSTVGSITETYSGSGGLHQAFVGAGWRPFRQLSVGFNFGFLWGTYKRSVSTSATTSINSLSKTYETSVNNYKLTLGLQWQQPVGRRDVITVGATAGLGHNLHADPTCQIVNLNTSTLVSDTTTFTISNGLKLPMTYGAGLAWQHRQRLTLAADVEMQKWGGVSYPAYDETTKVFDLRDGLLCNRTRMSMGADFVPDPNHPTNYMKHIHFRAGAHFATPYYKVNGADGPKEYGVSAGIGLPLLSKWNLQGHMRPVLNIGAQWVHTSASNLIAENTFRITLGLTFNERWFAKWRID